MARHHFLAWLIEQDQEMATSKATNANTTQ
jgi:hypothetical protein